MRPLSQEKGQLVSTWVKALDLAMASSKDNGSVDADLEVGPDRGIALLPLSQPLVSLKQPLFME